MKKTVDRLLLLTSLLAVVVMPSYGADEETIAVDLTVQKVEKFAEGEIFGNAESVRPGDLLQYQIIYKIRGKDEILELLAQLPIPEGMEYVSGSALPSAVQGSIDGKEFSPVPMQREIEAGKGEKSMEMIALPDYRILGWPMRGLAPGDEVRVSARFRVNFIPEERK